MKKRNNFYGITVELELVLVKNKEVDDYVKKFLLSKPFYIQKKKDGSQKFHYVPQPCDNVLPGYYVCRFSFSELPPQAE